MAGRLRDPAQSIACKQLPVPPPLSPFALLRFVRRAAVPEIQSIEEREKVLPGCQICLLFPKQINWFSVLRNFYARDATFLPTPSRCAARRSKALRPHDWVGPGWAQRAHHRGMHTDISPMCLPSMCPMEMSTPSRCAARRSVSVKQHARTNNGCPQAALRAADVYKSCG